MREIKFRALNSDGNMIFGWPSYDLPNSTAYYKDFSARMCWHTDSGGQANQPFRNGTLMQSTGIIDKNGNDIYEGDIVATKFYPMWMDRVSWEGPPDAVCEVYWGVAGFELKAYGEKDKRYLSLMELIDNAEEGSDLFFRMHANQTEVIGNIYKNPDLLMPYSK